MVLEILDIAAHITPFLASTFIPIWCDAMFEAGSKNESHAVLVSSRVFVEFISNPLFPI